MTGVLAMGANNITGTGSINATSFRVPLSSIYVLYAKATSLPAYSLFNGPGTIAFASTFTPQTTQTFNFATTTFTNNAITLPVAGLWRIEACWTFPLGYGSMCNVSLVRGYYGINANITGGGEQIDNYGIGHGGIIDTRPYIKTATEYRFNLSGVTRANVGDTITIVNGFTGGNTVPSSAVTTVLDGLFIRFTLLQQTS
jgi:hypothetical protein